jgi:protein-S-isoprenylcysteine O-methyltransferase Ste14
MSTKGIGMSQKMTKWGVGPKFLLLSLAYSLLPAGLTMLWPTLFRIPFVPQPMLVIVGSIIIAGGFIFYISALVTVMRAFSKGRLVTSGPFKGCRHPIYSAWALFIVPGIMLIINSWIGLSIPFVMCALIQLLSGHEERYLEATFGEAYLHYKAKTPAILPLGWFR